MLSSNQVPYDLSRRRNDHFYAEVVSEKPFYTIVFYCSSLRCQVSGVSCLKDRAGVSLYADASLVYTQFKRMNC